MDKSKILSCFVLISSGCVASGKSVDPCPVKDGVYLLYADRITGTCNERFGAALAFGENSPQICHAAITPRNGCEHFIEVTCLTQLDTQFFLHGVVINDESKFLDGHGVLSERSDKDGTLRCEGTYDIFIQREDGEYED